MNNGKSILDQIQDALGNMEDTGFLDELVNESESEGEDEGAPPATKPPLKPGYDDASS